MLHGLELIENLWRFVHLLRDALPDLGETSEHALRVFIHSMYFSIIWSLKKQHHKEKRRLLRPTHGETHLTGLSNRRFGAV